MLIKSLLAFILVCSGTASARDEINLVLNSTSASQTMKFIELSHTIDKSTRLIIEQAALPSLEGRTTLATDQNVVKKVARMWRSDRRSALFRLNDGILAYNQQFDAFYTVLAEYAPRINGDTQARSDFILMLEELKSEILLRKAEANETVSKFGAFLDSMLFQKKNIDKQSKHIQSTYPVKLDKLRIKLDDLHAELKIINEPVTVEPSELLNHTKAAEANFRRVADDIQKLQREIFELESAVSETTIFRRNVESLVADVGRAVDAASSMLNAWSQLELDYEHAINLLESSTDEARRARRDIKDTLESAKGQWELLSQDAATIKRQLLTQR